MTITNHKYDTIRHSLAPRQTTTAPKPLLSLALDSLIEIVPLS